MNNIPRDFFEVVDRVIACIPVERNTLILKLRDLVFDASFRAPELRVEDWRMLEKMLMHEIIVPRSEWEIKVSRIVCGKE